MDFVTEMVKNIVVIILLASFLEMLLPASNLRPFVRFAIGLFVVIAILNPVLSFINKGEDIKVDAWDMKWEQEQTDQVLEEGEELKQRILEQANAAVKGKVERQVGALAGLVPGVQALETKVDMDDRGKIRNIVLVVQTGSDETQDKVSEVRVWSEHQVYSNQQEQEAIKQKLLNLVQNLYGLDSSLIQIKFEGG